VSALNITCKNITDEILSAIEISVPINSSTKHNLLFFIEVRNIKT
jgi:hypothetical protein